MTIYNAPAYILTVTVIAASAIIFARFLWALASKRRPACPPQSRAWSALTDARFELTLPMTISTAEPVSDVLDCLPQLMADDVRKAARRSGIVTIDPGHYTVHVECIARFTKHKGPFR